MSDLMNDLRKLYGMANGSDTETGRICFRAIAELTRLREREKGLREAAIFARKQLEHGVPESCWATGPSTGIAFYDLIACPGCGAIAAIDKALSDLPAGQG